MLQFHSQPTLAGCWPAAQQPTGPPVLHRRLSHRQAGDHTWTTAPISVDHAIAACGTSAETTLGRSLTHPVDTGAAMPLRVVVGVQTSHRLRLRLPFPGCHPTLQQRPLTDARCGASEYLACVLDMTIPSVKRG